MGQILPAPSGPLMGSSLPFTALCTVSSTTQNFPDTLFCSLSLHSTGFSGLTGNFAHVFLLPARLSPQTATGVFSQLLTLPVLIHSSRGSHSRCLHAYLLPSTRPFTGVSLADRSKWTPPPTIRGRRTEKGIGTGTPGRLASEGYALRTRVPAPSRNR